MITPELLEYVRGEVARGRTRDDIHKSLVAEGGWVEEDISEAFRVLIPMPNMIQPDPAMMVKVEKGEEIKMELPVDNKIDLNQGEHHHHLPIWAKILVFLFILLGSLFTLWYYGPLLKSLFIKTANPEKVIQMNTVKVVENTIKKEVNKIIDCGMGEVPKVGVPSTGENANVLACLGYGALNCDEAKAVLKDELFPTIFEITKINDSCNFRLSYAPDSTLMDITGKRLATEYISCPLSIVKAMDNKKPTAPKFIAPEKSDLSKYASQIYLYGTLGLFVENNLDKNKIASLGCSGEYIDTMIASYKAKK